MKPDLFSKASLYYKENISTSSAFGLSDLHLFFFETHYIAFGLNARSLVDSVFRTRDLLVNDHGQKKGEDEDLYCNFSNCRFLSLLAEWNTLFSKGTIRVYNFDSALQTWVQHSILETPAQYTNYTTSTDNIDNSEMSDSASILLPGDLYIQRLPLVSQSPRHIFSVGLRIYGSQNNRTISVAVVDTTSMLLQCGTFIDSDDYDSLRILITLFKIQSITLRIDMNSLSTLSTFTEDSTEIETIEAIFKQNNISIEYGEESSCKYTSDGYLAIQSLLNDRGVYCLDTISNDKHAIGMLSYFIKQHSLSTFLSSSNETKSLTKTSFSFQGFVLNNFMYLDSSALTALNIYPSPLDTEKTMCLYGLLNQTKTVNGSKRLHQWLSTPLRSLDAIEQRLNMVEIFTKYPTILDSLRQILTSLPAIDKYLKKITKTMNSTSLSSEQKAGILEIYGLYQFSSRLPAIVEQFTQIRDGLQDELDQISPTTDDMTRKQHVTELLYTFNKLFYLPFSSHQSSLIPFEDMVQNVVDFAAINRHEYIVKASFDEELTEIDKELSKILKEMNALRDSVEDDLGLSGNNVKLNSSGVFGYFLRVSRKDEAALRSKKQYITLEARKDGVKFTLPDMKRLSSAYSKAIHRYKSTQSVIESKSVQVASTFLSIFTSLSNHITTLDVLMSFAIVSVQAEPCYVRPIIVPSSESIIEFRNARHPCLEVQVGVSFISNDLILSGSNDDSLQSPYITEDLDKPTRVQIITGPNMGGKSTYIRTAGVCSIMAQIGCFVPCSYAKISLLSSILVRIGAGDAAQKGMSTFMKEMVEASAIIRSAVPSSLVIIDELGRGTSTYDGFGLAWAIAEHLASPEINAFCLFATHFHELTALANVSKCVKNRHVTATTGTGVITMLYQVRDGPSDRSFGIHVAELARFPEEVVALARQKALELEAFGHETTHLLDITNKASKENLQSSPNKKQKT